MVISGTHAFLDVAPPGVETQSLVQLYSLHKWILGNLGRSVLGRTLGWVNARQPRRTAYCNLGFNHVWAQQQQEAVKNASVVIKVGMVGDAQIGKTSLMVKYVEGSWDEDYIQTLGALHHAFSRSCSF